MKFVVVVAILAFAVAHEDGPDNLALHAEHFPHTQGSKSAIYQFQIDNNNAKAKQTSAVQFTAEISPDMDIENAYFYNERSQSNPGAKAQKGKCKIGQRSPSSQKDIQKRFPGARITFPKRPPFLLGVIGPRACVDRSVCAMVDGWMTNQTSEGASC